MSLDFTRIGKWLIVAPITASLCASVAFAIANWAFEFGAPDPSTSAFNSFPGPLIGITLFLWIVSGILAIIANGTIGVLWQVIAHRYRIRYLIAHLAAGAVCGLAFATTIVWQPLTWSIQDGRALSLLPLLLFGALIGTLTALFAWRIRRPDRDAPNPPTSTP